MQDVEIASSPLKNINPADYTISIRPRPGGFCFVLYDKTTRKFPVFYDTTANSIDQLLGLWEQIGIEGERYHNIVVVDDCEKWTLLPLEMKEAELNAVWQLNFGQLPATPLQEAAIKPVGARCIFEPTEKSRLLKERFLNATLTAVPVADIHYAVLTSQTAPDHYLGLDIREKQLSLQLVEKGKLILANAYDVDTTSDMLYFAMNTVRIFQLDQKETVVEVWGKGCGDLAKQLAPYLQKVKPAELNNRFEYENGIKKLANKHEYYDLFNIVTCAL